jgi:putative DNA primase/helicase
MYLTAEVVGDRTLGLSEARRIVNAATFSFSGINVSARADFVRRTLAVKLDPNVEHPEERTFLIPDLRGHVLRARPRLLRAVLTMLRAFVLAGAPAPERPPLGGFEQWDRVVCGALVWLGMPDPLDTQHGIRGEDPEASTAAALFEALEAAFPDSGAMFKAADVRAIVAGDVPGQPGALAQAVHEACNGPEKLGYWLRAHHNQIRGSRKLLRTTGKTTGNATWRIKRVA